jgi:hypothetical protein
MKQILALLIRTDQALLSKPPGICPDKKLTPGAMAPATQAEVLRTGYTMDARHLTDQTKWEVRLRYELVKGVYHVERGTD